MTYTLLYILVAVVAGVLSGLAFLSYYKKTSKTQQVAFEKERDRQLEEAKREAEVIKKDAAVSVKDAVYQAKAEAEREIRERTREMNHLDKRLRQKEESLEKKIDQLERKENDLAKKERDVVSKEKQITEKENQSQQLINEQMQVLEKISGMRPDEAKQELFRRIEEESRFEAAKLIKKIEDEAKENAEKKANEVISFAIQRYAADYVADATVSAVSLPGDEMKGRIIGREGRNIRAFEAATGVDIIVDDTPEMVTLSAHDPVRREIAHWPSENW